MGKKPRGRVEPDVYKGTKLETKQVGIGEAILASNRHRSYCEGGHNTYLFSRFCTNCGHILTDEEYEQLKD